MAPIYTGPDSKPVATSDSTSGVQHHGFTGAASSVMRKHQLKGPLLAQIHNPASLAHNKTRGAFGPRLRRTLRRGYLGKLGNRESPSLALVARDSGTKNSRRNRAECKKGAQSLIPSSRCA
jgi:hypothetical protein